MKVLNKISALVNSINKIDNRILIFGLLAINYLSFEVSGNMDQYLSYLKYYSDKSWFPHTIWFDDFPGTRFLFQLMFGWMMQFLNFESMAFFGRFLSVLLITFPVAKLFTKGKVPNLIMLAFLQIIWLSNQSLYAGGWMIGGFETKVLAYFFALYGVLDVLENRRYRGMILLAISTSFHILVGGWISIVVGIWFLLQRLDLKLLIKYYLVYGLLSLPIIIYMYMGTVDSGETIINGINTDWIYTYYRNPHHTTPFKSSHLFFRNYFWGILISGFVGIVSLTFLRKRVKDMPFLNALNMLLIALLIQQFIMLIVAGFDTNGTFLKTYPFRTSVFTHLFAWVLLISYFVNTENKANFIVRLSKWKNHFSALLIVLVLSSLVYKIDSMEYDRFLGKESEDYEELISYVKTNTSKDDLFISMYKNIPMSFMRKSNRNQFVVQKIIPSEKSEIYSWYCRMEERDSVFQDPYYVLQVAEKYHLDYAISNKRVDADGLTLVFHAGSFYLYKIRPQSIMALEALSRKSSF